MERFPSLINSLKTGFEEGRSTIELLRLLDEMRGELTRNRPAADHTQSPVSIWLPAGYQPPSEKNIQPSSGTNLPETAVENIEDVSIISSSLKDSLNIQTIPEKKAEVFSDKPDYHELNPLLVTGVPRPPLVASMEELEEGPEQELQDETDSFPKGDVFLLPGNFHINPSGIFRDSLPFNRILTPEMQPELPIVVELELPDEIPAKEGGREHTSMTITDNFLKQNTPQTESRPLELHEILANRAIAQPANGDLPKQGRVLADSFAGGKIQDIRKSIAINDRFRYINSLFRGDESLFERSVKTINNFNILQEAQYWMQRELVIKLGWNEEDELVQMFYQLVSRRFL
jgi:hypothetical protein